jgi:hypothetical protein
VTKIFSHVVIYFPNSTSEEDIIDTILFQLSGNVVCDEEPTNGTCIWDEEEENVANGMGGTSVFDVNLETIFYIPCREKSFYN